MSEAGPDLRELTAGETVTSAAPNTMREVQREMHASRGEAE